MTNKQTVETLELIGGWLCLDFANTANWSGEETSKDWLLGSAELLAWGSRVGCIEDGAEGVEEISAETHHQAIALRTAIHNIFTAISNERPVAQPDLTIVNQLLSEGMAQAQIAVNDDQFNWHWSDSHPADKRIVWAVARSAAHLLTAPELKKVKMCGGHDCGWLFVDSSKNQRRRWCSMEACGNRAKARRHYRRHKATNS